MPTTKTTQLEAVNRMLTAAGEAVVAALGTSDSAQAEQVLDDVERDVQAHGWHWNTRTRTFTVAAGEIAIADDVVSIDTGNQYVNLTIRGGKLFDMETGTDDEFTADICLRVVELLDWDDIPQLARSYIVALSQQRYVESVTADMALADRLQRVAATAMVSLMRDEARVGNYSVLSTSARRIQNRVKPLDIYGAY